MTFWRIWPNVVSSEEDTNASLGSSIMRPNQRRERVKSCWVFNDNACGVTWRDLMDLSLVSLLLMLPIITHVIMNLEKSCTLPGSVPSQNDDSRSEFPNKLTPDSHHHQS